MCAVPSASNVAESFSVDEVVCANADPASRSSNNPEILIVMGVPGNGKKRHSASVILCALRDELSLSESVLAALNHPLCDLLAKFYGVEWFVLREPPQNRQLGAQHVAVGNSSNHLARSGFNLLHRLG